MANEWIAWTKGLTRKVEIARIAERLGVDRHSAAAMCMEVWEWADDNTADGSVARMSAQMVSEIVGRAGVAEAMVEAGWIIENERGLMFVKWNRWNAKSGKKRLLDRDRKRRQRRS